MFKRIIDYIKMVLKKIIEWFKNLFKKEKTVVFNGKEIKVVKPKLPLISGTMDVISSVIGSKSNLDKNKIKKIDIEIKELINNLSRKSLEEVKNSVLEIEEKIEKTRKEIRGSFKEDKIIKKEMEQLDKHEHVLKSLSLAYDEDEKENKKHDNKNEKASKKQEEVKVKEEKKKQDNIDKKNNIDVIDISLIDDEKETINMVDNTPRKLVEYSEYVKYVNELLKDGSKLIKQIIGELNIDHDMELNKIKIEELKKKIIEVRKKYYDFKHSDYIYILEQDFLLNELDEYEVIKSSQKIDFYLNKCNSILQTIEYMRENKEVIPSSKKEEKKENKKENKKEKMEDIPKIQLEIEQANLMIIKEIKAQQKEISKFLNKLNSISIPEKRTKKLGFFSNFLNNTLRFGGGFINIFRNRNLGLLTNGYLLNNRLRLLRRIINPNIDVFCITFNRRIKNEIDIINNYQTICNDSLYQITSLKEEFVRSFGYNIDDEDVKEIFTKLVNLEKQITIQQQNLVNAKIKINSKIKLKKFYH